MAKKRETITSHIKQYFLTGIFTVLPIVGTSVVVKFLVGILWQRSEFIVYQVPRSILEQVTPQALQQSVPAMATAIGLLTVFILTIIIGVLTRILVGRTLIRWFENLIKNIPFVSWVYATIRQVIDTFNPGAGQKKKFQKAVLVKIDPKSKGYILSFLTNVVDITLKGKPRKFYCLYFPCNQMIQGYNLFVEEKDCVVLDIPVDEAIKQVVSLGIITPPGLRMDHAWDLGGVKKLKAASKTRRKA